LRREEGSGKRRKGGGKKEAAGRAAVDAAPGNPSGFGFGQPGTTASDERARTVHETQHDTAQLMMPQHANVLGHVFGGVVLAMMDTTAAVSAIRHARLACVTVSVDRVDFREPIHVGDLVIMKSSVNFVGRTSMEVGVRVETENLLTGVRRHTNSCYLTFVAVDRNGRPVPVPPLRPETPDEIRRYEAARQRRERRLQERLSEEGSRD
jgi:acyl-CoA hydrolase